MKSYLFMMFLCISIIGSAQELFVSGLNKKEFAKHWKVESESADYKVSFSGDTTEIISPKGLTLWRKEKMKGNITIEYDACVMMEEGSKEDRLSDLNCFWMASDSKYPENLWKREKWRSGIFLNCYSLQLYYLGYGGNHNSTTRFRRYNGDENGIKETTARPAILKEYTDKEHLLKPNHWYHIKISNVGDRVTYYIDGEKLVDYRDENPLKEGWFGFRTTLSRTRITNFKCHSSEVYTQLKWVGEKPNNDTPASFGVPFKKGDVKGINDISLRDGKGNQIAADFRVLAYWQDGSVKWGGISSLIPKEADNLYIDKSNNNNISKQQIIIENTGNTIKIGTGPLTATLTSNGNSIIDSLVYNGITVACSGKLVCSTQSTPLQEGVKNISYENYESKIKNLSIERKGKVSAVVKIEGIHYNINTNREWLPFVVRLYFYAGSPEIKMVHSFVFDGDQHKDFINSLGIKFDVPLRDELYNRHVAFSTADGGVWSEPVQPLTGRRVLSLKREKGGDDKEFVLQRLQMEGKRISPYNEFDEYNRSLLDNWASWNSYRLSQINSDAFSIRKRANDDNPWIGTFNGTRATGYAFVGDVTGGLGIMYKDFWQSYPSSIEITDTKTTNAKITIWLWSPESEPMDLRHYDNVAHDLNASYEDVQEGMSTPYGIARTTSITILPQEGYKGKENFAQTARYLSNDNFLMALPEYLHERKAFGVWSLPDRSNDFRSSVENRLDTYIDFYKKAIEQNKWYGFWNYGDVMHAYDPVRHEWKYDVGGFAWDNTELASNMWLWYNFLRTGRSDLWNMAAAMARHTAEVDVYHIGTNSGLGSRHNVSHWGCGAKEARISQAAWNRFYYYLTGDERFGDLMKEVTDADQKLYTLDPMRLAEPRSMYPCTAPARLRIGPDWLAYAGNWMTEWERTRNTKYRDKIITGMKCIADFPNGLFTGPKTLGFYPDTGVITKEGDPDLKSTNHLMTIMGGFEIMNEIMDMVNIPKWNKTWLYFAQNYKDMAMKISRNRFRVSRLISYAAWQLKDEKLRKEAWKDLMTRMEHTEAPPFVINKILPPQVPAPIDECPSISTNDAAMWSLDAIYMQEVIPE